MIVSGVLLHVREFLAARDMSYQMAGTGMSWQMRLSMGLILCGICATAYGLFPLDDEETKASRRKLARQFEIYSPTAAALSPTHWGLVLVLGVALIVDVMKPATLGFAVPGMRNEYGLSASTVSLLPLFAMIGTTVGSVAWGILADRLGRRGAILLASLIFIGTAICGAMPSFTWNLVMCFFMGMSAGGMLPIVFALLAELAPARQRGWLSVLMGGLGTSGGYLVASGAAAWLEPHFTWRILWLLGLPSGLLVILLNRYIPESPRFLIEHGRIDEAQIELAKFGAELRPKSGPSPTEPRRERTTVELFRKPYLVLTLAVCGYGVAWGLVNWGFLTWLPTILRDFLQLDPTVANFVLAKSALVAIPGCVVVAILYGHWSSKKTMVLFALGTAGVLLAFAFFREQLTSGANWLSILVVALLVGLSGMIAMLPPYSAELYPTALRATGIGLTASSSKVGGVIGPSSVAFILTFFPGVAVPALLLSVPLMLSALFLSLNGIETKGKALEEIVEP